MYSGSATDAASCPFQRDKLQESLREGVCAHPDR